MSQAVWSVAVREFDVARHRQINGSGCIPACVDGWRLTVMIGTAG